MKAKQVNQQSGLIFHEWRKNYNKNHDAAVESEPLPADADASQPLEDTEIEPLPADAARFY